MSRYEELKEIFERREYFKIVCGAGNEDAEEVRKLSLIYTLAGALGIDISANVEVVKSSSLGVDQAFELAPKLGIKLKTRPFINVSIGMRGDPHIRKAKIDASLCTHCDACRKDCIQKAIADQHQVIEKKCIGCGDCARVCPVNAVTFFDKRSELKTILPECLKNGVETFELHAIIPDDESVEKDWQLMAGFLKDNFISMCMDRSQLSDHHLIKRIKSALAVTPDRLIVQADGVPMSGGSDDFNTTLQTVAISDIIIKHKLPVKILASGGTNSKTGELLKLCGVKVHGISIGTFARKIVVTIINQKDFDNDLALLKQAVNVAKKLVDANMEPLRG
ncbi:hypothetical protein A2276_06000 [candidate division WOR-1 bacterium RIFOXYA12_FULL_43_27]|uniref:4Fe-4S ferredoxin-type domain-containing protein n=1 Tax=candidate division WOR-1 bacterium RIFOXYC2_FULL_46_14 TaxID=1802587 RepID=A0A1F4U587_UNCSA|nr:MAG: hypothetical protein A2276_06000 [candidate division WOR-1 bacterium RIFOXYA12_FULL_43_27]OGC20211.1 MAG: hypothetical protein A2292_04000 [candidate division WOR-1 bacterium RIFOXYB2_FULL_46_45]OGC32051.1 MAG: hypothetical protein A2232_07445 [candidate division WOR-1 bacterium RIFOXYA2_FULL_46_56]OGC39453.1 MAG: hypothetical protein A2438_07810 [candidate division WOR-1 bacterium RIFOXYC2_FULL_46_14]